MREEVWCCRRLQVKESTVILFQILWPLVSGLQFVWLMRGLKSIPVRNIRSLSAPCKAGLLMPAFMMSSSDPWGNKSTPPDLQWDPFRLCFSYNRGHGRTLSESAWGYLAEFVLCCSMQSELSLKAPEISSSIASVDSMKHTTLQ